MKILGYDYTVDRSRSVDRIGALGNFTASDQVIQLGSNMNRQQAESTLLHEILEALKFHLELSLEHREIMALEAGIYQVLTDNGVDLSPLLGPPAA